MVEGAEVAASTPLAALEKAAKDTVSSIHERQMTSEVEGTAPPKRGSRAARTLTEERAAGRSDLRSMELGTC